MTDYVLSDTESAMLDNYNTRIYYDDYIKCETVDIPKKYFPMQYAMPIQKHLPYFDALYYHMNTMKVNKKVFWNHILSRILQKICGFALQERGSMKQIKERYRTEPQQCPEYSGKPLGFGQTFTAFGVIFFGMGVAIILIV